jgi:hypothetical protein
MPGDHNLLSLDASLAIPTRVLLFEASRRQRPGRSDHPPGRLDRPGWPHLLVESSASVVWLNREPSGFHVNHCKPRELGVASANRHS